MKDAETKQWTQDGVHKMATLHVTTCAVTGYDMLYTCY
jgi:hypothetical protein